MGKKDGKPRGKMSSYAYFVQTCREEHKKKHLGESVQFTEFSKKCSEKWKVRSYLSLDFFCVACSGPVVLKGITWDLIRWWIGLYVFMLVVNGCQRKEEV